MNVVIAIDSFKGSMTSMQAGLSAATGIKRVYKDAHITVRPLADGGEGTVDALVSGCDGRMTQVQVTGPAGRPVVCPYGIIDETHTAIIEMSGAAGGMGFAFLTFCNATLESGIKIILEETHLEKYIRDADVVITGEGRLDGQTVMGKAPIGVAKIAKKYEKPVLAFSGCVAKEAVACNAEGIDAFFPILRNVVSLDEAMHTDNAMTNMADTVEQVFRALQIFHR